MPAPHTPEHLAALLNAATAETDDHLHVCLNSLGAEAVLFGLHYVAWHMGDTPYTPQARTMLNGFAERMGIPPA